MRRFSTSVAWGFALLACLLLLRIGLTVAEPTSPILFGMSEMPGNASQPLRKLLPSVVSISIHRTVTQDASPMNASGGTPMRRSLLRHRIGHERARMVATVLARRMSGG